jgi:carboxymethylenebutenolidase
MCHSEDRLLLDSTATDLPFDRASFVQEDGHATPYFRVGDPDSYGRILLLHDGLGPSPFYHDVATTLAAKGYYVVAPNYYSRLSGVPRDPAALRVTRQTEMDEPRVLADIVAQCVELATGGHPIAVVGFCYGGTLAFHLGATSGCVSSIVSYYGLLRAEPAWSKVGLPDVLELTDRLAMPMQLFWGTDDEIAYDAGAIAEFVKALGGRGNSPRVTTYRGADHSFLAHLSSNEETPDSVAAKASWQIASAFLQETLTG